MSDGKLGNSSHALAAALSTVLTFLVLALHPFAAAASSDAPSIPKGSAIPNHYIVVLEDSTRHVAAVADDQAEEVDGDVSLVYRHALKGYAATLPKSEVQTLEEDPQVKYVVPDIKAEAFSQEVPAGLERIGAPSNGSLGIDERDDVRVDADVAVIDTGIDLDQPDLNVVAHTDCVPADSNEKTEKCEDGYWPSIYPAIHGTHVAGTIGALDNGEGVVGVAPGARIWSVKALSNGGSGSFSWIIAGIDWVAAHADKIEVANMSIGGGCWIEVEEFEEGKGCTFPPVEEAIEAAQEAGVVFVVAAGNQGVDVKYEVPGSDPDVITVSALADYDGKPGGRSPQTCNGYGHDDELAWFSNWGEGIDIAAPGVCIYSTEPDGKYGYLSGTSMATPHVTGAAAIIASKSQPEDLADVEAIGEELKEEGSSEYQGDAYRDGVNEPLLDVSDEAAFDASPQVAVTGTPKVLSSSEAVLKGAVEGVSEATSYRFEYGKTTAYGTSVPAPSGSTLGGQLSETIGGLEADTTYHYRLVATNEAGEFEGEDETFYTSIVLPSVETGAGSVGPNKHVNFTGVVNPHGAKVRYHFELGETTAYESSSAPIEIAGGSKDVDVSEESSNNLKSPLYLKDETTYHFRLAVTSAAGTFYGADQTVTTPALPRICKALQEDSRCDGKNYYSSGNKLQGSITEPLVLANSLGDISCSESTFTAYGFGAWIEAGTASGTVSFQGPMTWTVGGCGTNEAMNNCAVESLDAPENGSIEWTEGANGAVSFPFADEGGFLEWKFDCAVGGVPHAIECRYKVDPTATLEGGDPARMILDDDIGDAAEGAHCPEGTSLEADYAFSAPKPMYVARQWYPPVATSEAASDVTSESAILHGTVKPRGAKVDYHFEWATAGEFARGEYQSTPVETLEPGTAPVAVSAEVEGLEDAKLYDARLVASNGGGNTSYGKATTIAPGSTLTALCYGNPAAEEESESEEEESEDVEAGSCAPADRVSDQGSGFWAESTTPVELQIDAIGGGLEKLECESKITGELNSEAGHPLRLTIWTWSLEGCFNETSIEMCETYYGGSYAGSAIATGGGDGELAVRGQAASWEFAWDPFGDYCPSFSQCVMVLESADFTFEGGSSAQLVLGETDAAYGSTSKCLSRHLKVLGGATFSLAESGFAYLAIPEPGSPKVTTEAAGEATGSSALLHATVDPEGGDTMYHFEWGTQIEFEEGEYNHATADAEVGSDYEEVAVQQEAEGLEADTTYHYRVVAESEEGTAYGEAESFATPKPPKAATEAETFVKGTGAVLKGTVNPEGSTTSYWFEYDTSPYEGEAEHGTKIPLSAATIGSGSSGVAVSRAPSGLKVGTTYHFRVVAENDGGTAYGNDKSFTAIAAPKATTEAATSVKNSSATLNGKVNPEGSAADYFFEYADSEEFEATGKYGHKTEAKSAGSGTTDVAESAALSGIKAGTLYHFRIVAESEGGTGQGEDMTFATPYDTRFESSFGKEGSGNGQLKSPKGIAVDSSGNVWVADTANSRIEEFSAKGEFLTAFGKEGSGNGEFKSPKGIAIDSEGNVWVADTGNNRVQKFNAEGKYILKFGKEGTGNGEFKSPTALALDSVDRAFVVDSANNRVQKFKSNGEYLTQFGSKGTGNGQFEAPTGIAFDASGIWVADTGNNRVQKFSSTSYAYLSQLGKSGSGNGEFKSPTAIAVDFQGRLWVIDSGNDRAQKFDTQGTYVDQFGEPGSGAGQLESPVALALPAAQKVLVLDTGNNRIESWSVKAEPPTATTNAATSIGAASANLKGTVNPEGLATTYYFEYGKTISYGTKTSEKSAGSGTSGKAYEEPISGLDPNTTYHFRVIAKGGGYTAEGKDKTFTTLKAPKATTEAATEVKATSAKLNGTVNPEGSEASYYFEYDTTAYEGAATHGTKVPVPAKSAGSGTSNVAESEALSSLKSGTTYHFRIVADKGGYTVPGADKEFTTLKAPKATTEAASEVKTTSAKLNGTVNPEGTATSYYFEWGEGKAFDHKTTESSAGSGTSNVAVNAALSELKAGTEYRFRLVAKGATTVTGEEKALTTLKAPKATTEVATEVKATSAKLNGTVNPEGSATSYYFEYGKTTSYGSKTSETSAGSGTSNVAASASLSGLEVGQIYHFRVVANGATTVPGGDVTFMAAENPTFSFAFGKDGSANGELRYPRGMAIDSTGNLWVADSENNRIQKFNSKGEYVSKFGTAGSGNGQLLSPSAIAVDSEGNLWVADSGNHRIQKFNSKGEYLTKFGTVGEGNGQFQSPVSIAIDSSGNLWVGDESINRIQKFNSKGEYLTKFGEMGEGNGQFVGVDGIAIDSSGNLWVADWGNNRIQKFNSKGEYLAKVTEGSGNQLSGPKGIAIDSSGNLWVAEAGALVEQIGPGGEHLTQFGQFGEGSGKFLSPSAIAIDSSGNLWVLDEEERPYHVQKWVR